MRPETRAEQALTLWKLVRRLSDEPAAYSTTQLASEAGYARGHLDRMSRDLLGEPIGAVVARFRLERAAHELLATRAPVGALAVHAGYASAEAFTKEFRKRFGVSPLRFRSDGCPLPNGAVSWMSAQQGAVGIEDGSLTELGTLKIAGQLYVGDYGAIPGAWRVLAKALPERLASDAETRFVTVFHSDGLRGHDRETMRAHLGFVLGDQPVPRGFEVIEIPPGPTIRTVILTGPAEHAGRWRALNQRWVPKNQAAKRLQPGYDEYANIPADWNAVKLTISLAVVA